MPLRETSVSTPFVVPHGDALYISDTLSGSVLRAYRNAAFVNVTTGYQIALTAAPGSPVAQSTIEVDSTAPLPYAVQATAHDAGRWLRADDVYEGMLPARFTVTADATNLQPGVYAGSVHLSVPGSVPPVQTIRVTLTVSK